MTQLATASRDDASEGEGPVSGEELQSGLARLAERVEAIQIGAFEEDAGTVQTLVAEIVDALTEGGELLDELLRYEDEQQASEAAAADFYAEVETLMSSAKGRERLASVAFISKWELANKRSRLLAVAENGDAGNLIDECGSARRKLLKAAIALEMALGEHEGRPSRLASAYRSELDRSILTRRAYTELYRNIAGDDDPTGEEVEGRVKQAARAIARLVLTDIYADLRASDRRELRELRARVSAWLAGENRQDVTTGQRLWQDIRSFAELLLQVNNRVQLIEHDEALLATTRRRLLDGELRLTDLPAVLQPVLGRDAELDELILRSTGKDTAPLAEAGDNGALWLGVIERVLCRLEGRESTASGDGDTRVRFGT